MILKIFNLIFKNLLLSLLDYKSFLVIAFSFLSVACNSSVENVEDLITRIENEDFSGLQNITASYRSKDGLFNEIYMVSKTNNNCRPFVVTYNNWRGNIESANDKLAKKSSGSQHCRILEKKLETVLSKIKNLNLYSLTIDDKGMFFETSSMDEIRVVARLLNSKNDSLRIRGKNYKKLRENWYFSSD